MERKRRNKNGKGRNQRKTGGIYHDTQNGYGSIK